MTSVTVTGEPIFVSLRQVHRFTATAELSDGTSRDITNEAVWTSSDRDIVAVLRAGEVIAERPAVAARLAQRLRTWRAWLDAVAAPGREPDVPITVLRKKP